MKRIDKMLFNSYELRAMQKKLNILIKCNNDFKKELFELLKKYGVIHEKK